MRIFFIVAMALITTTPAFAAENPFKKLPFGIVIGETTNIEIENRGTCVKKIEVSQRYFRCEQYEMTAGGFNIYSSQNETVKEIRFVPGNRLPRAWLQSGLKWDLSAKQLMNLLKTIDEISYLEINERGQYDDGSTMSHVISFEVGKHLYVSQVWTDSDTQEEYGNFRILEAF